MKRTKELVDEALGVIDRGPAQITDTRRAAETLAAEVRALRVIVERVEALPEKWRRKRGCSTGTLTPAEAALIGFTFRDCADELEAALKGSD